MSRFFATEGLLRPQKKLAAEEAHSRSPTLLHNKVRSQLQAVPMQNKITPGFPQDVDRHRDAPLLYPNICAFNKIFVHPRAPLSRNRAGCEAFMTILATEQKFYRRVQRGVSQA